MKTRRPRGRPPSSHRADSRGRILSAARELFAKHGLRSTTTRAIAAKARVDAALVHYFFGTKAALFAEAVEVPIPVEELRQVLEHTHGPRGPVIARFFLEHVFNTRNRAISAILRAAMADPASAPLLRTLLETRVAGALEGLIPLPPARLRAEIIGAQFVGLFVLRHVIGVEPLASASIDSIVALVGPGVDAVLGSGL